MFHTLTRLFPLSPLARPGLFARLSAVRALTRSRRALAELDAQRLSDIGLTEAEAQSEARRKPWDAPANWTC